MGKFTFTVSTAPKSKQSKPVKKETKKIKKVLLEKHSTEMMSTEMYTYIGTDGEEHKYNGILNKGSNNEAYGKIYENHNVDLIYHPGVEHVAGQKAYFTYIDPNNNQEHKYIGKIEYDLENDTYVGIITKTEIDDTLIQIFEEK